MTIIDPDLNNQFINSLIRSIKKAEYIRCGI